MSVFDTDITWNDHALIWSTSMNVSHFPQLLHKYSLDSIFKETVLVLPMFTVLCWWLVHQSMQGEGHSKEPVCDVTGRFRIRDSDTGTGTGAFLRPRACKLWLKRKYSFFSLSICNVLINWLYMSMSPGNLNLINNKHNVLFSHISLF